MTGVQTCALPIFGGLQDFEQHDLLSGEERRQLENSYDYLLRVRTELHYRADRGADTLTPNHQPVVAAGLGYEGDPRRRTERFMRDYYTAARTIHLITRTLEDRLALTAGEAGKRRWTDLLRLRKPSQSPAESVDGFQVDRGQLHFVDKRVFRDQPARLMRALDRKSTRLNSSHIPLSRMPSSA